MTTAQLAMEISDDTGLPLSDVLEMDLEMLMWNYPGSEADELEQTADADDFSFVDELDAPTFEDILPSDFTGHTTEEYRRDDWEAGFGVSYMDQADDDDNPEWA